MAVEWKVAFVAGGKGIDAAAAADVAAVVVVPVVPEQAVAVAAAANCVEAVVVVEAGWRHMEKCRLQAWSEQRQLADCRGEH